MMTKAIGLFLFAMLLAGCGRFGGPREALFVTHDLTPANTFTAGVEGPAVDADGNIYAVNFAREGTIGRVTPSGQSSLFIDLPLGSTGNGIRFDRAGNMYVADYTGHNVLRIRMRTHLINVFAHEGSMSQPNDIAIDRNDILFASDPNWRGLSGRIWRIDRGGKVSLLEDKMGTTNGIEVDWSRRRLYVGISRSHLIWVYDLSRRGEVSNKRMLIDFKDTFGMDGMRCDAKGNLYVTRHGKGTVAIVSPEGRLIREVKLTGKKPTNITFGGPDGKTCYVTLADRGNLEWFRTDTRGQSYRKWWAPAL